jgi:hypothetical protein
MTERPEGAPDAPPDEPEAAPEAETETGAPEGAGAAAEELYTESGAIDTETDYAEADELEDELEADEAEADELEDELAEETTAPLGAEPGDAVTGTAVGGVRRRRDAPPSVQRAPTQSELAVHVTDMASRIFVIVTVVVFAAILAFGIVAGHGGLLTTTPAPSATPSESAEPSASASAGTSVAPSAEPSASPS